MKYGNYSYPYGYEEKQEQPAKEIRRKTVQKQTYQQPAGYGLHSTSQTQTTGQIQAQEQQAPQAPAADPNMDYNQQLDDLYAQIMNRPQFQFDVNQDALYQQLRDSYIANGRLAMEDTMGQAAALTGGYGNSYAQAVGQQAYNQYLQGLTDEIPDLYQMALNQYMMEGDAMYDQLAALQWKAEFDEDQRRYDQAWEQEYGTGTDGNTGGNPTGNPTENPTGNPTANPTGDDTVDDFTQAELSEAGQNFLKNLPYLHAGGDVEGWKRTVAGMLYRALENGTLSEDDGVLIMMQLGLEDIVPDDKAYTAPKEEKQYSGRGGSAGSNYRDRVAGGR